ncbi:MarR family transcriptional regulator [uncultured Maricaulis sp.]|uniref:MarR family winged helix-turn-helix transcriptional regulator n=1 Tax=uncultured Maricaulis sp. TaxID=174710 RepID=UPI0030DBC108|tara:strand:+ start:77879 stop:78352 length:474 start_codon:yes stop_codon:yes gene_type:complete
MSEIPFFDGRAAFALRVRQASVDLYEQMDECLQAHGLLLPAYATSLVQTLFHVGSQSVSALAEELGLSHQLASQRLKWLEKEGLVEIGDDPDDRRRRQVRLTESGTQEAQKLQTFLPLLERAYSHLFDEIGMDLHRGLVDGRNALSTKSLLARMQAS